MIPTILLTLAALAGFTLLAVGLRGRRIDDHPICRRCRFDLVGVYPASAQCPECGVDLGGPRDLRKGNRRKRRGMMATGATLALPVLLVGGAVTAAAIADYDLNRIKPVAWLLYDLRATDGAGSDAAVTELERRLTAGDLPAKSASRAIDYILDRQARWRPEMATPRPPMQACFSFVGVAAANGIVTEAQVTRAVRQALRIDPAYRTRVASGSQAVIQAFVRLEPFAQSTYGMLAIDAEFRINGRLIGSDGEVPMIPANGMLGKLWWFHRPRMDVPPGHYELEVTYTVRLYPSNYDPMAGEPAKARAEWQVVKHLPISVVGPDDPVVELVTAQAEDAPNVSLNGNEIRLSRWAAPSGGPTLEGRVSCTGSLPLYCDVIVRSEDREFSTGYEWFWSSGYYRLGLAIPDAGQITTDTVDIILRPNPDAAAMATTFSRIWGEPIILRNVKVARPGAPTPASSFPDADAEAAPPAPAGTPPPE